MFKIKGELEAAGFLKGGLMQGNLLCKKRRRKRLITRNMMKRLMKILK